MSGPPNTILIEPADGQQRIVEKIAASVTTPGALLTVDSSDELELGTTVLASAAKLFALENVAVFPETTKMVQAVSIVRLRDDWFLFEV